MTDVARLLLYLFAVWFIHPDPYSPEKLQAYQDKMAPIYADLGIPADTSNVQLQRLPYNIYGGTMANWGTDCTNAVKIGYKTVDRGDVLWKYILAHEWAHVAQGPNCANNEDEATIMALAVLAEGGEYNALLNAVMWFGVETEKGKSKTGSLEKILSDSDGLFELKSNQTLDARKVWHLLNHLAQNRRHYANNHVSGSR